jgi:hypothetical protein
MGKLFPAFLLKKRDRLSHFLLFAPATKTGKYRLTNPDRSTTPNKLNCTWIVD